MHTTVKPVANLENIEILVDNVLKTKFSFPDNATLRGQKIRIIDVPQVADVSTTPTGKANVNATVYNKSFLVLSIGGSEKINRIPLKSLDPFKNAGVRLLFDDLQIDWNKSYIEVGTIAGLVLNEAFFINIFF